VVEGGHEMVRQRDTAFKRGIMNFEDYNYDAFNDHILLRDEVFEARKKEEEIERKQLELLR